MFKLDKNMGISPINLSEGLKIDKYNRLDKNPHKTSINSINGFISAVEHSPKKLNKSSDFNDNQLYQFNKNYIIEEERELSKACCTDKAAEGCFIF